MAVLFSFGEFDYQIIDAEYEMRAISLVGECFSKNELMSRYFNLSAKIIEEAAENNLDQHLGREVSSICIHRPTRSLCGVAIAIGCNPDAPDIPFIPSNIHSESEKNSLFTMHRFFRAMSERFFQETSLDPKFCLHQCMIAIDKV